MELHGTGTPLGDPTEVGALVGVFQASGRGAPLAIVAAKGNVGHSEPVSGLLGLAKVELQLRLGSWYGNAQLRVVNPLLVERFIGRSASYALPTHAVAASTGAGPVTGLSSFGYSGTIAHLVLDGTPLASLPPSSCARFASSRFMHRRFAWVDKALPRSSCGELSSSSASLKWEHTLDASELAFFRSHRVGLVSLLPGTCYIEFARNVAIASNGGTPYTLDRISFEVCLTTRCYD